MLKLLKNVTPKTIDKPDNIETHDVCIQTGLLAIIANQCDTRKELFIKNNLPPAQSDLQKQIWVRRSDKFPILQGDNTVDRDLEQHTVVSDAFIKDFCLDCTYPKNDKGQTTWPSFTVDYSTLNIFHPH